MSFDEVLFPPNISKGATGGEVFSTVVVVAGSGAEQRIGQWAKARLRYDVAHATRSRALAGEVRSFFLARAGRLRGFRFKDWLDYSSKDPDGTERKHDCSSLSSTTFQL